MRKIILILIASFCYLKNEAQETSTQPEPKAKHELWANVTPIAAVLLYSTDHNKYFDLMYKRVNKSGKGACRLGLGLSFPEKNTYYYSNGYNNSNYKIIEDNDSIQVREIGSTHRNAAPSLSLGYEFIRGKKWKWYFGADAVCSYHENWGNVTDVYLDKKNIMGTPSQPTPLYHQLFQEKTYTSYYSYINSSIAPFFGVRYPFSDRFSASLQAMALLGVSTGHGYSQSYNGAKHTSSTIQYDATHRMSLNLAYCF